MAAQKISYKILYQLFIKVFHDLFLQSYFAFLFYFCDYIKKVECKIIYNIYSLESFWKFRVNFIGDNYDFHFDINKYFNTCSNF